MYICVFFNSSMSYIKATQTETMCLSVYIYIYIYIFFFFLQNSIILYQGQLSKYRFITKSLHSPSDLPDLRSSNHSVFQTNTHHRENAGTLRMVAWLFNPPRSPLERDIPNKYPRYKVFFGGWLLRVPLKFEGIPSTTSKRRVTPHKQDKSKSTKTFWLEPSATA